MNAGNMRYRVSVEGPITTQNRFGEPEPVWTEVLRTWASKEDLTGTEDTRSGQVLSLVSTRFTMRYASGIAPAMRATCEGVVYEINDVLDPDGRKRSLVLLTTRKN